MAMITCPECGREVSSLARSCPNCGAPIQVEKKIKIHFHRKKAFSGSAISGPVFVDGVRVGTADNGCSFDATISPGNHVISTETAANQFGTGGKGNSTNIEVPNNASSVDVEITLQTHLMGASVAIGKISIQ